MSDSPIDGFLPDEAEEDDLAPTRAEPVHLPASAQAPDPFDEATFEDDTTQTEEADDGALDEPATAPSPFAAPVDTGIRAVTGRVTKPVRGAITRPASPNAHALRPLSDEVDGEEEAETVMNYVDPLAEPEEMPTAQRFASIGDIEPATQVEPLPAPPALENASGFRVAPPPALPEIDPAPVDAQPVGRAVLIMVAVGVLSLILGLGGGIIAWVALN